MAGGDDEMRAGMLRGIRHRRFQPTEEPFSHIEAEGMDFRRTQARHRLSEAERLVLVAGFAVADDEDSRRVTHVR